MLKPFIGISMVDHGTAFETAAIGFSDGLTSEISPLWMWMDEAVRITAQTINKIIDTNE